MLLQSLVFISCWSAVSRYVSSNGPIPHARTLIWLNSWLYAAASLALLAAINSPYQDEARYLYHYSKFYEYIDILLVRGTGGSIDLHFGFHHLTTPYLTHFRVRQHSQGWQVFASLNALHHAFMYAFFGGAGAFRRVLPYTGTAQLVVGILNELFVLRQSEEAHLPQWPNVCTILLLSAYLVLWVRDLRARRV